MIADQIARKEVVWSPTMNLRFVERRDHRVINGVAQHVFVLRVLQQEWFCMESGGVIGSPREWRDVPLVSEE